MELRNKALDQKIQFEDGRFIRKELEHLNEQKAKEERTIKLLEEEVELLQKKLKFQEDERGRLRVELLSVGGPADEQLEQAKQMASSWDIQSLSRTLTDEVSLVETLKQELNETNKDIKEMKTKYKKVGDELVLHYESKVRNMETYISDLALKLQTLQLEILKSKYST